MAPVLKPGTLQVEFITARERPWPNSWFVNSGNSLEETKLAAQNTLKGNVYPTAVGFVIFDHEDKELYRELPDAQRP